MRAEKVQFPALNLVFVNFFFVHFFSPQLRILFPLPRRSLFDLFGFAESAIIPA